MPRHSTKYALTFSLFVGSMSTIAIFCTLRLLYIMFVAYEGTECDELILWGGILPLSLLLSIFLGKHCYRKTAPEYINTVFKGKMAIVYSVLISFLIALGIYYIWIYITNHFEMCESKTILDTTMCSVPVMLLCLIIGISSGIYCYKKVKDSVVYEDVEES